MKKGLLVAVLCLSVALVVKAQSSIKETFDSNSLGWTESNYESNSGSAVIDKGVMTITSNGINKFWYTGKNTFYETHCYAPLDVRKPFKIVTHVHIDKLDWDQLVGMILNYKDNGNFYSFSYNDEQVNFLRYVDNRLVGSINQGVSLKKKKKLDQEWVLEYDGNIFTFTVDGEQMLYVRYMELSYAGVGFYTYGKQTLVIDDIEFIQ